jgi:acyl carrier protein
MEKFIKNLNDVFERSNGKIKPEDIFREYQEWDSLVLLSLMAMFEDEYGKTIPREDFEKLISIEDLYNYIISR